MSALGDEFRNAREARGLTLSDVAERLHIRSVYLAAIEDEDWPVIGAPVYVRGFMRTYARFLGLDAEAAVARFSAAAPASAPSGAASRPAPAIAEPAGERRSPSLGAILVIVVAVVAVAFVGYEFYAYRAGPPVTAGPAAVDASPDADASAAPAAADDVPAAVASAAPRAAVAKPGSKRGLGLQVTEASWVRVVVDGKVAYEGTLPAGAAKSFRGSAVDVRVGNAGGVKLVVDGRPLGPLGASGDVVERHFALAGE